MPNLIAPFSSTRFFDVGNQDGRSFMLIEGFNLSLDLFPLHFLIWGEAFPLMTFQLRVDRVIWRLRYVYFSKT